MIVLLNCGDDLVKVEELKCVLLNILIRKLLASLIVHLVVSSELFTFLYKVLRTKFLKILNPSLIYCKILFISYLYLEFFTYFFSCNTSQHLNFMDSIPKK